MMTAQELADRLAELSGWTRIDAGWWRHPNRIDETKNHPVKVGSIDALEAFRTEKLSEWEWLEHGIWKDGCYSRVGNRKTGEFKDGQATNIWDSYAAALIAAEENK